MNNLNQEIAKICKSWCDDPNDCEIEIAPAHLNDKPDLLFRFVDFEDTKDDWFIIELRFFDKEVTVEDIESFMAKIPENKRVKEKVIVSRIGFSMDAAILANQKKIWLCHFWELENEPKKFGYLLNIISNQEIHTNSILTQAEWQAIHSKTEESGFDFMRGNPKIKAEILDEQLQKKYDFKTLEFALPNDVHAKNLFHKFELPNSYLKITDIDMLPIHAISFKYFTDFRKVEAKNLVEALGKILSNYIFG